MKARTGVRSRRGYENTLSSPRFVKRDIASLIRTCEASYVRIITLIPDIDELLGQRDRIDPPEAASCRFVSKASRSTSARDGLLVSRVVGAQDLYLRILEHRRYTTVLNLTYRLSSADIDRDPNRGGNSDGRSFEQGESGAGVREGQAALPNARIHVYHDARAAELVSQSRRPSFRIDPDAQSGRRPSPTPELERKWRMNRFLMKWLGFCLYQGHIFLPGMPGVSHLP